MLNVEERFAAGVTVTWLQEVGESRTKIVVYVLEQKSIRRSSHLHEDVVMQRLSNRQPLVILHGLTMNGARLRRGVLPARTSRRDCGIERCLICLIIQDERRIVGCANSAQEFHKRRQALLILRTNKYNTMLGDVFLDVLSIVLPGVRLQRSS